MTNQELRIRLGPDDAEGKWGPQMLAKAGRALDQAEQRLGLTLNCTVRVLSFRTEWDFQRYVGERPMHVVAVARPRQCEVVILRPSWFTEGPIRQEQVLVHEMAHLIIGRRVAGALPNWLNEGLAMVTAREDDFERSWRVVLAGTLGGLLPLDDLEDSAAFTGPAQELAYSESLALTKFYLQRALPDQKVAPNNPAPLARALADPQSGPVLLKRLWDPNFRIALEIQWRRSERSLWSWLAMLSGTSVLWIYITLLFLLAYWRKRRMAQLVRERFTAEENAAVEFGTEPQPWEYGVDGEGEDGAGDDEDEDRKEK